MVEKSGLDKKVLKSWVGVGICSGEHFGGGGERSGGGGESSSFGIFSGVSLRLGGERSGGGGERSGVGIFSGVSLGLGGGDENEIGVVIGCLPDDLFLFREVGQDGGVGVGAEEVLHI
uniref:Glycine-rich protein 23-like n=1 Tax=Cicer arietinum TaxID=3827 RepID=A0A1S2Y4Z9_CICAR|nr:glycine-rich protein 23-like [Cicer arietinum]